jgi:hypothetical protein
MARRWPRHHDVCRWLVLLDCVAELVTFVAFLLAYETQRQFMVSDTLFALPAYAIALTVFLMVRLMFGVLYVATRRLSDKQRADRDALSKFAWAHAAAYAGFLMAAFGWVWLCRHREDPDHVAGVFVFAGGSVLGSLALVMLASLTEHGSMHVIHTRIAFGVLAAGGGLAAAFMAMYFTRSPVTWIVEHVAYALHLAFWAVFFTYHWHVQHVLGDEQTGYELGDVPQQCQPLLHPVRPVYPQLAVPI